MAGVVENEPPARPAKPTVDPSAESAAAWNPDGTELARGLLARAKLKSGYSQASSSRSARSGATASRRGQRRSWGAGWSGPSDDQRDPQPLDTALDRLAGEHGWGEQLAVHGVIARWDQIVGPEMATHVRTDRYDDGVLTVRADSTAWATQVKLLVPDLVRRLNSEIGDGAVQRVVVLGPHTPSWRKGPRSVPGRGPRDTYG